VVVEVTLPISRHNVVHLILVAVVRVVLERLERPVMLLLISVLAAGPAL
jgi:hypothetical protein